MIPTLYGVVGKPIRLTGYAQDFGAGIACVQFSADGGETWTSYPVARAERDANVNWEFVFTPPCEGRFELLVRSAREDGTSTPEPAHVFMVVESDSAQAFAEGDTLNCSL